LVRYYRSNDQYARVHNQRHILPLQGLADWNKTVKILRAKQCSVRHQQHLRDKQHRCRCHRDYPGGRRGEIHHQSRPRGLQFHPVQDTGQHQKPRQRHDRQHWYRQGLQHGQSGLAEVSEPLQAVHNLQRGAGGIHQSVTAWFVACSR